MFFDAFGGCQESDRGKERHFFELLDVWLLPVSTVGGGRSAGVTCVVSVLVSNNELLHVIIPFCCARRSGWWM